MILNQDRIGNITSSNCWKLFATPAKVKTYIKELNYERSLGRSLSTETSTRPMAWGKLNEIRVFNDLLDTEYTLTSKTTVLHPEIKCWAGSPEGLKGKNTVYDIKCPQLKSFCELVEIIEKQDTEFFKTECPEYYYQLVSNSILLNTSHAELIVYCPYQGELEPIRKLAANLDDWELQSQLYWLERSSDEELPYLPNNGNYTNLNKFLFEVPQADKDALTEKIQECEKLLIPALNLIEN